MTDREKLAENRKRGKMEKVTYHVRLYYRDDTSHDIAAKCDTLDKSISYANFLMGACAVITTFKVIKITTIEEEIDLDYWNTPEGIEQSR